MFRLEIINHEKLRRKSTKKIPINHEKIKKVPKTLEKLSKLGKKLLKFALFSPKAIFLCVLINLMLKKFQIFGKYVSRKNS